MFWGNGGGSGTGDYDTPLGAIHNSRTRTANGVGRGFGRFGERGFFTLGYGYDNRRYGVPFAAQLRGRRRGGVDRPRHAPPQLSASRAGRPASTRRSTGYRVALNYSDYEHKELESDEVGTLFSNKLLTYRGTFDQRRWGRLRGEFRLSGPVPRVSDDGGGGARPAGDAAGGRGLHAPRARPRRLSFQFGGRVENNRYRPEYASGCRRAPSLVFRARPARASGSGRGASSSPTTRTPTAPRRSKSSTTSARTSGR